MPTMASPTQRRSPQLEKSKIRGFGARHLVVFDSALDLTSPTSFKGIIPYVDFNGTDEEADTPDSAYHSRVTGAFSIWLWIRPSDVTSVTLFGKLILTTSSEDAEYVLQIDGSSKLDLTVYDTSAATTNWTMNRPSSSSIVADQWQFVLVTVNATQTAATDINLYINGALDNGTGAKGASFTAMEAGAALPSLGFHIGASCQRTVLCWTNGRRASRSWLRPSRTECRCGATNV